ncbi:MAG: Maf family protein [Solirubrobacteraceae bacterium]
MPFEVRVPEVAELADGPPVEVVLENAHRKAVAVASGLSDAEAATSCVLGVDTVVVLGSRIFGKPRDEADTRQTLTALAGRRHAVLSGICLIEPGPAPLSVEPGPALRSPEPARVRTAAARTAVEFRELDETAIDAYLATGEWRGRAGGYAIQGAGAALVRSVEGDYLSVVGLPVATLLDLAPWLAR